MKIIIAGSGLLGRLLAIKLHALGHEIHLYDRDDQSGNASCGMTAAGLLTPLSELENAGPLIYWMGQKCFSFWPEFLQQFSEKIYFAMNGQLDLAHTVDHALFENFVTNISAKSPEANIFSVINQPQLQQLEPELENFQQAIYFPKVAQLDNQHLMSVLTNKIIEENISWYTGINVVAVKPHQLILENKTISADLTIDCRGMGATSNFPQLRAIRGDLVSDNAVFHIFAVLLLSVCRMLVSSAPC